jgi:hypothetical protein
MEIQKVVMNTTYLLTRIIHEFSWQGAEMAVGSGHHSETHHRNTCRIFTATIRVAALRVPLRGMVFDHPWPPAEDVSNEDGPK